MSAISLPANSPKIHNLEEILENAATLTNLDTAMMDPSIRTRIEEHCPNVSKEQIYNPDKVKTAITQGGKILGTVFAYAGNYLAKGVNSVGNYIHEKVDEGDDLSEDTKKKWSDLKEGTNKAITVGGEYLSAILNPVVTKGKEWGKGIGEKIEKSENENVQYAKGIYFHLF